MDSPKERKETKEKDMDNKDTTTQDKAKERAPKDGKYSTKETALADKEKEKGQGNTTGKGKGYTTGCYRCGQQGHTAKDCRFPVYNIQEDVYEGCNDATDQWYGQ